MYGLYGIVLVTLTEFINVNGQNMSNNYTNYMNVSTTPEIISCFETKPAVVGSVIASFLLIIVLVGIIIAIKRRSEGIKPRHRPTHSMMYSVSMTNDFIRTLKDSVKGTKLSSSTTSGTSRAQLHERNRETNGPNRSEIPPPYHNPRPLQILHPPSYDDVISEDTDVRPPPYKFDAEYEI